MDTKEVLMKLSNSFGVSSYESYTFDLIENIIKENFKDIELRKSGTGNLIAKYGNTGKKIGFFAHVDEIGVVISKIVDDCFARVEMIGGVDPRVVISKRIYFVKNGKEKIGVIGMLAPHLQNAKNKSKSPSFDELFIDFSISGGTKDIDVGDMGYIKMESKELQNGVITGKSLDNRVGVTVLLKALDYLKDFKFDGELHLAFNKGEEVGLVGAKGTAYDIFPESAIIVDVTFSEDLPANVETMLLGKGPAIARGSAINDEVFDLLIKICKDENIKHQVEVLPMRTGTETDVVQMTKTGVKTGLVSVPIYNMHSPVECVDLSDIDASSKLLALFAMKEGKKR